MGETGPALLAGLDDHPMPASLDNTEEARLGWVTEAGGAPVAPRPYHAAMREASLWAGKTLRQWLPVVVEDVVRAVAPHRIVLFGSVARGDEGPDSDLDLLVVLNRIKPADRARLVSSIRRAISARAPIDVFVTDLAEYECRKDVIGSMIYWPAREGEVVYERAS